MNPFVALLGAIGIWLVWTAVTHPLTLKLTKLKTPRLARAAAEMSLEDYQGVTILENKPILDRAFGSMLESWSIGIGGLLGKPERDKKRIIQAGNPPRYKTIYDFYAWKVMCAVMLFALGLFPALFVGSGFLLITLLLGVLGLFLPDLQLKKLIKKRQELIRTELAFTLHRLAIHIAAGRTLQMAVRAVANKPGGLFVAELRQVVTDCNTGVAFKEALERVAERNPDLVEVERFIDLVTRAEKYGQPLVRTLSEMGEIMQEKQETEVKAQGLATSVKMVLPMGLLVLPAIGLVVIGPAIYVGAQLLF